MQIRKLYIKVIATRDFKKHYGKNWQEIIKKTIQDSSGIFEKEFGIKLILKEIKVRNFIPVFDVPLHCLDYIIRFRSEVSNKFDATVIFTNNPIFVGGPSSSAALGIIMSSARIILLTNPETTKLWAEIDGCEKYKNLDSSFLKFLLLHEISHLFGAKNIEDEKSYLAAKCHPNVCYFDKTSKKTILKNKWKKFRK